MRTLYVAALIGLLSLAACGSDPSESPSAATTATASEAASAQPAASDEAALPAGWTRVTVEEAGFSIALPEGWIAASPDDLQAGLFEQLAEDNPEAAAALEQAGQAIESGQLQFFGFDGGERTAQAGFAANVNVINIGDPGPSTVEEIADQMAAGLPQQIPVDGEVRTHTTTLPAGEAAVADLEWTVQQGSESISVALTQYAIITEDDGFIVSFTAPKQFAAEYQAMWGDVAETFRVE